MTSFFGPIRSSSVFGVLPCKALAYFGAPFFFSAMYTAQTMNQNSRNAGRISFGAFLKNNTANRAFSLTKLQIINLVSLKNIF